MSVHHQTSAHHERQHTKLVRLWENRFNFLIKESSAAATEANTPMEKQKEEEPQILKISQISELNDKMLIRFKTNQCFTHVMFVIVIHILKYSYKINIFYDRETILSYILLFLYT